MNNYKYIKLSVYVTLAVLAGVYAHKVVEHLQYIVGSLMLLYALDSFITAFGEKKHKALLDVHPYLGAVELIMGIMLIVSIKDFETICVVWATWTIIREAFEFYEMAHMVKINFFPVLSIIESVVEIVFSILLIMHPTEHHALTHVYLLIPELIISGFSPLLLHFHKKRKKK